MSNLLRALHLSRSLLSRDFEGVGLRVQVGNQGSYIWITQSQVGHLHLLVFGIQGSRDWISFRHHPIRHLNKVSEPRAATNARNPEEIRPYAVALADSMAGSAASSEKVRALGRLNH